MEPRPEETLIIFACCDLSSSGLNDWLTTAAPMVFVSMFSRSLSLKDSAREMIPALLMRTSTRPKSFSTVAAASVMDLSSVTSI